MTSRFSLFFLVVSMVFGTLFPAIGLRAQDTTFYTSCLQTVADRSTAEYYEIVKRSPSDTDQAVVRQFSMNDQLRSEKHYSSYSKFTYNGISRSWHQNGELRSVVSYKQGNLHGDVITYWDDGSKKRVDLYEDGVLVSGKIYNRDGTEGAWCEYVTEAEFPGGNDALVKFVSRTIKYPKASKKAGHSGLTIVRFCVNALGEPENPTILVSVSPEFDEEVLRMISKMPRWRPGTKDCEPTITAFNLPVRFSL